MKKRLKKKKRTPVQPELIMYTDSYKRFLRDFLSLCEKDEQVTTIVDVDMVEPEKIDTTLKGWE